MQKHTLTLSATLLLASACIDNTVVSPENAATVDALSGALTRGGVTTLALGVLAADRAYVRGDATYYQLSSIYSRDVYRVEATEPRYVTETLTGAGRHVAVGPPAAAREAARIRRAGERLGHVAGLSGLDAIHITRVNRAELVVGRVAADVGAVGSEDPERERRHAPSRQRAAQRVHRRGILRRHDGVVDARRGQQQRGRQRQCVILHV